MAEDTIARKILLAVDGSEQSLTAVRYVAGIIPPEDTEVVLFYVGTEFPEIFWDMDRNPLYRTKMPSVMGWLADQQVGVGKFREVAIGALLHAGFPSDRVHMKTQTKQNDIAGDITQESYRDYSAVVVGRTGVGRIRDFIAGSVTTRLIRKIKHVPLVVVGGHPVSNKILVALDTSIESMRGVNSVGVLAGTRKRDVTLLHILQLQGGFKISGANPNAGDGEQEWLEYSKNKIKPCMDEATRRLAEAGIAASRIVRKFITCAKSNPVPAAIEEAQKGNYGTIVVGQREVISFADEFIRGRFSQKLIKMADNMAIWVVS